MRSTSLTMVTRDAPTPADDIERCVAFEAIRARLFASEAQPVAIGRFLVTSRIGQGGMGVVYSAYDPQLDRRVAVKLVRDLGRDDEEIERARRSLAREARAAARLAHPNVVTVYDSGSAGQAFYVAMEYVDGPTLRRWLRLAPRHWTEILALFIATGRGLQAAHAAGLVHCDFKPDNVLVGSDGRPRVADFGLAKWMSSHGDLPVDGDGRAPTLRSSETSSTLGGTPSYMAPEQYTGRGIGPHSDQFAYCVALYEALFEARPYPSRDDLQSEMHARERSQAHQRTAVPRAIVRAVLRGLHHEPKARHLSMDALVDQLERTLRRRSLVRWGALGLAAAVLTGAVGYAVAEAPLDPCEQAAAPLDTHWGEAERSVTRDALGAAQGVIVDLDAYAQAWGTMRRESCEATHHRGEQSAELLGLRTACLDRRLHVFQQAVAHLQALGPNQGVTARRIVDWLPTVDGCSADAVRTEHAVRGMTQGATDRSRTVDTEAAHAEVLDQLGDARLELILGRDVEALALARAAEDRARTMTLRYLEAEATVLRAGIQADRGQLDGLEADLLRALALATQADDADTAASAIAARLALERQGGPVVADRPLLLALGRAWALRTHRAATLGASLALEDATDHSARGDHTKALEILAAAVASLAEGGRVDDRMAWALRSEQGQVLMKTGRLGEAERVLTTVLAQQRALLPAGHADLGDTSFMLAEVLRLRGHANQALPLVTEARAIYRDRFGELHPRSISAQRTLAELLQQRGEWAEAAQAFEQLIADHERMHGADHPNHAVYLNQLAELELEAGPPERARDHARQAMSLAATAFGAESPLTFAFGITLGKAELALGRLERARPLLTTARDRLRGSPGADPAWAAEAAHHLARLAMLAQPPDPAQALAWSDEALEGLRGAEGITAERLAHDIAQWRKRSGLAPP